MTSRELRTVDGDLVRPARSAQPEKDTPRPEQCPNCRGRIRWYITAKNRAWIPVDAIPDPAGNLLRLSDGTVAAIGKKSQREAMREQGRIFLMPHAATCTKAGEWVRTEKPAKRPPRRGVRR